MAQPGAPTLGTALNARTAADVRNWLIELKDQAVAANRGDEPFLHGGAGGDDHEHAQLTRQHDDRL
jgi:hypothetical protein